MRSLAAAHPVPDSAAARAFGATVSLGPAPGRGLCLVVGRRSSPSGLVAGAGATVVARIDGRRVLALAEWEVIQTLSRHPEIRLAGGVSVDPERFAAFCELAGIDTSDDRVMGASSAREE